MEYTIEFTFNKEYLLESHDELVNAKKGRKFQLVASCLFVVIGVLLLLFKMLDFQFWAFLFIFWGLVNPFLATIQKPFWVRKCMSSPQFNKDISVTFTEEGLKTVGAFSNADIQWGGLYEIVHTAKGVIIRYQKQVNLYISKSTLSEEVEDFILQKRSLCFVEKK